MAVSRRIKVMISSRCNDPFPAGSTLTLSAVREQLKRDLEGSMLFGRQIFDVWINEVAPPSSATHDSWETCLQQVRDCDILIILANGNAGWAEAAGDIGICHAEAKEGLDRARSKVRLISLGNIAPRSGMNGDRDRRFQDYLSRQTLFRGGEITTVDTLMTRVREATHDALISLTQQGGQALDWSRMDFRQRKVAMEAVLAAAIGGRRDAETIAAGVVVPLSGRKVLFIAHAVPAALSVAAARELVGQPFLRDHECAASLAARVGGPVHVIACHRSATEGQATKLLGFPDATVVSAPFGIYVADNVQKVQFAFLANCRDEDGTRHVAQRFFEWLRQTGEEERLSARAAARARIVRAIANGAGAA
jgi:hypothetical protein